jgi:hypothetical protein
MGLRCLLGHEYANREVEREREERGDEVVVTYRTVETCDRCGERRIVSENKEVRPVRDPESDAVATGLGGGAGVTPDLGEGDAPSADDGGAAAPTGDEGGPADDGGAAAPTGDEGGPVDDGAAAAPTTEPNADANAAAEEGASAGADEPAAGDGTDVDDAIILDDGPGDDDRDRGEWPDDGADDGGDEPEPAPEPPSDAVDDGATVVSGDDEWPEPDGEDEGFDAEPSDGEATDVAFGGELTPEGSVEESSAAANGAASTAATGKQFVSAETVDPVRDEDHDGETEFFCPNCGHARTAGGSSMRAGDICPDCHQGYIAERPR